MNKNVDQCKIASSKGKANSQYSKKLKFKKILQKEKKRSKKHIKIFMYIYSFYNSPKIKIQVYLTDYIKRKNANKKIQTKCNANCQINKKLLYII